MRRRFIRNREAVDEYFTIESLEDECVISLTGRAGIEGNGLCVWYSINNSHWAYNNLFENPITLKKGYKVRFKYDAVMGTFVITKKCKILGSIMSLCFMDDFKNKTSLESHAFPELFKGCNTIVSVDKGFLPATTLSDSCYKEMFYGCTSLTSAPDLPATILTYKGYYKMFYNCTKLNYIKMLATDIFAVDCLYNWVYGVSPTGTFVKSKDATWNTTPGALGSDGVPAGWTVITEDEESKTVNNVVMTIGKGGIFRLLTVTMEYPALSLLKLEYSTDKGITWIEHGATIPIGYTTFSNPAYHLLGDSVQYRLNPSEDDVYIYQFTVVE